MNLYYYYLTQQEPAAWDEMNAFLGYPSLQGIEEIRLLPVESRLLLYDELIAGDGSDDWDLYTAFSLYNLAALIKSSQSYYPF
jgi:hypothetical protein